MRGKSSAYGSSNNKSPAQLKASVKALEAFKKEDMKPEPVVDALGNTLVLKVAPDHMKIIISRAIGERLKTHIADSEYEGYLDELLSWNTIFEKLLDQIQDLKKQVIEESKEESESELESELKSRFEPELYHDFPLYSDSDIPIKISQPVLELWKRLHKVVLAREKEYVISQSALLRELIETYLQVKELKVEGQDHFMRIVSANNSPGLTPNNKSSSKIGSKHKRPKVGPIFSELQH